MISMTNRVAIQLGWKRSVGISPGMKFRPNNATAIVRVSAIVLRFQPDEMVIRPPMIIAVLRHQRRR